MRLSSRNKYLSSRCAVLCTGSTRIEAQNPEAHKAGLFTVGSFLSDYMYPVDVLKFEAASKCLFTLPPLIFPVRAGKSFSFAAAFFEEIMGMRFAVTVLYKSRRECLIDTENTENTPCAEKSLIHSLILGLTDIEKESAMSSERHGTLRFCSFTEIAVRRIAESCGFFDCDLIFDYPYGQDGSFDCPGIESYIKTLSLMLYSANDLSCDRIIVVSVASHDNSPSVCIRTRTNRQDCAFYDIQTLSETFPQLCSALTLCEYCAGCCGLEFTAENAPDSSIAFMLKESTSYLPEADFKCPDGLPDIGNFCDAADKMLKKLFSSDKQ